MKPGDVLSFGEFEAVVLAATADGDVFTTERVRDGEAVREVWGGSRRPDARRVGPCAASKFRVDFLAAMAAGIACEMAARRSEEVEDTLDEDVGVGGPFALKRELRHRYPWSSPEERDAALAALD